MAAEDSGLTAQLKFEKYNPYAERVQELIAEGGGGSLHEAGIVASLAVAFELKQLNGAVRFGNQGRS